MNATEMAYRKTAAQGASGLGLLIALYDTLAGDLRRAAEADRSNNIQKRCEAVNHALLVLAHLEDRIDRGRGGQLAQTLAAFYKNLRRKLIEAQAKRSPEILEEQMAMVLDIRKTWQEAESRTPAHQEVPQWVPTSEYPGTATTMFERQAFNWSA